MNIVKHLFVIAICLLAASHMNAQTSDWQVVEALTQGTTVGIRIQNHRGLRECTLFKATHNELGCNVQRGNTSRQVTFLSSEIREVRLEYPERNHTLRGAIIGGAVGGILGGLLASGSNDPEERVGYPILTTLGGAALGAGFGHHYHRHGPILFQKTSGRN